ncbi:hypothetical protein XA68_13947 [Ophiocordyceps unilateralis]|uniref:Uncharacterized protein n=1 Tax=Ophiocordyceps unilateralis TaxID=268505 RepID=A0A2A9PN75_OPHUN|nr:hypothetical protein XA68_13947 [Ophiocordyceps unilateralis]
MSKGEAAAISRRELDERARNHLHLPVGYGLDDIVWKVGIDNRTAVRKVFWDTEFNLLKPSPRTFSDAVRNQYAFSNEGHFF